MGWFTRSKIKRGRPASEPSPPSVSITDPPNVFTAARPPPPPKPSPPRNNGGPSSPGFAAEPLPPPSSSYQPSPFQFASSPGRASGPPPGHPPQHRVSPQQQQQQQQHQHQQHQQRRSFSGLSPHPPPSHPPPSQQLRTPFQGPSQPSRPSPSGGPPPPQQHRTPLPLPSQPRPIPSRPPQTQHNSHPGPHPARSSLPTQILHPPNQLYSNPLASLSQPHLQPSGFLPPPPPPGWNSQGYQPVIVNQHYYLGPPLPPRSQTPHEGSLGEFSRSVVNLAKDVVPGGSQLYDEGLSAWNNYGSSLATSVYDHVYSSFNNVMTLIDREHFYGNETDLFHFQPPPDHGPHASAGPSEVLDRGFSKPKKSSKSKTKHPSGNVTASVVAGTYFSKIELYANSRLPRDLPPLILYTPTWPLLCLAAQYSQRVYDRPTGNELDAHVNSDWRTGTKAMCIKSVPMDDMHTIIFAIRGTATFMDWAVNLNMAHSSPHGFLDDPGNLCHAGFLSVAKKMIKPVAARLRQLLQENPSRSSYSLLITGHSAGGAVAALLYSHMLATSRQAESELNLLTGCFKRIHCVTFGTPPVSLLPLTKPNRSDLRKSVFLSFINEGDPVVRADKGYIRSLLEVLALPPPVVVKHSRDKKSNRKSQPKMIMGPAWSKPSSSSSSSNSKSSSKVPKPVWKVPACTLSNAGRLVLLRSGDPKAKPRDRKTVKDRLNEGVLAVTCGEETLRGVIFGDPVAHMMSLYAGRIEILAVGSITGKRR